MSVLSSEQKEASDPFSHFPLCLSEMGMIFLHFLKTSKLNNARAVYENAKSNMEVSGWLSIAVFYFLKLTFPKTFKMSSLKVGIKLSAVEVLIESNIGKSN